MTSQLKRLDARGVSRDFGYSAAIITNIKAKNPCLDSPLVHVNIGSIGAYATGHIAIGKVVDGVKTIQVDDTNNLLRTVSQSEVRALIKHEFPQMWGWVVKAITGFFR